MMIPIEFPIEVIMLYGGIITSVIVSTGTPPSSAFCQHQKFFLPATNSPHPATTATLSTDKASRAPPASEPSRSSR